MTSPTVSFVVPCYKLAHLLPECIESILSQSYEDFEILIMDDRSPDATPEVARSFTDRRIRYIRNDRNLGHLRNYNKGISLSRGQYVWLISADDYLRRPYVLDRYVRLLDQHPTVGYAFCPGYGVHEGTETSLLGYHSRRWSRDRIFRGHVLLRTLLRSNYVLAPSGIVRRECYQKVSLFDLSMPWCGDWYLWCLFAVYYDVAYFAEPMVCYRAHHDFSMTTKLTAQKLDECAAEEVAVSWAIRNAAKEAGHVALSAQCLSAVAHTYARTLASERYRTARAFMTFDEFENAISANHLNESERAYLRAHVYAGIADHCYWRGELALARHFYESALKIQPWILPALVKRCLLGLGAVGDHCRRLVMACR